MRILRVSRTRARVYVAFEKKGDEIPNPLTCRPTLFRRKFRVDVLLRVEEMQCVDWLICLAWIQDGGICCVTITEFDEKQATEEKFVAQSRPAL